MRVAIATFGADVSPRFCFAREVLLVDVEDGRETGRAPLVMGEACNPDRLRLLRSRGATLLLCGGFNREFLPEAERQGVHVIWGLDGSVEALVAEVAAGKLASGRAHRECWCRGRGARRAARAAGVRGRARAEGAETE